MNAIERTIRDVVIANRILALNKVVDACGQVSIRHPDGADRIFLARSVSPASVGQVSTGTRPAIGKTYLALNYS